MNMKMKIYRTLSAPLRGHNMDRYPTLIKLHNYFVKKASSSLIEVNGYKMKADIGDFLHFQYTGGYEPLSTDILKGIIKEGDVVVDVGANIGYYTLLFSQLVGKTGRVYAFEPEPRNYALLKENILLNGFTNIVAEQKAVSNQPGSVKLYLHETNAGGHTITKVYEDLKSIDVDCVTLDEYFSQNPRVDFLKVDVEGAEEFVLQGARKTIEGCGGVLLEFNTDIMLANKTDFVSLFIGLMEKGYCFRGINEKEKTVSYLSMQSISLLGDTHKGKTLNVLCQKDKMVR